MPPSQPERRPTTRRPTDPQTVDPKRPQQQPPTTKLSESYVLGCILGATAILTIAYLRWLGIFGPGEWTSEDELSRVTFLTQGRDEFLHFMQQHNDKPTVFAFYSDTCPACKHMRAPFLECSAQVPDAHFVALNVKHNRDFALELGLKAIPTVYFLGPQQPLDDRVEYTGKASIAELRTFVRDQTHRITPA